MQRKNFKKSVIGTEELLLEAPSEIFIRGMTPIFVK